MWFWIILALIFLAYAVVIFIIKDCDYDFGWTLSALISCAIVFGLLLGSIANRVDYNKFEKAFEIQKEQFNMIAEKGNIGNSEYIYVIDAINSNKQLAEYQASKSLWGFASTIPERVFDIEPIGIE